MARPDDYRSAGAETSAVGIEALALVADDPAGRGVVAPALVRVAFAGPEPDSVAVHAVLNDAP